MANKIVANQDNCPFHVKDCVSCYWSHVKDGQWTGSERCWNSQCIMLDPAYVRHMQKTGGTFL